MELEKAILLLREMQYNCMQKGTYIDPKSEQKAQAIETVLHELYPLQKENEELKEIDLTTVYLKGVCDEKERWRNKIKELIIKKKQQIQDNNKQMEECRKTIMEEQELKRLKLYTLHKNNELLKREIADLFDLLKEE